MKGMNKVFLLGNAGSTPQLRQTTTGQAVTNFQLATTEHRRDKATGEMKEHTEWHWIACWSGLAEHICQHVQKGDILHIEGQIVHREYVDKEGVKQYRTDIRAREVRFMHKSGQGGQPPAQAAPEQPPAADPGGRTDYDEDIPF